MKTIMRYEPTNNMVNFLDELFSENFFKYNIPEKIKSPAYDLIEMDDKYLIEYMLPGFNKEDVSVQVEDSVLHIEGKRKVQKDLKYNRKGSFYGQFKKSFALPDDVVSSEINASFNNGVLSLEVEKNEKTEPNKIIEIQ